MPADLAAVGFAVFLCVELGGADGGAGVDEEEARHGEGGEGCHYSLERVLVWAGKGGSNRDEAIERMGDVRGH